VERGGSGEPGDLSTEQAHWLTRDLIAWDVEDAAAEYALHTSAEGGLELVAGGIGGGERVELEWVAGDLPAELAERFPHLPTSRSARAPRASTSRPR
jgi:hypothetical protein